MANCNNTMQTKQHASLKKTALIFKQKQDLQARDYFL